MMRSSNVAISACSARRDVFVRGVAIQINLNLNSLHRINQLESVFTAED